MPLHLFASFPKTKSLIIFYNILVRTTKLPNKKVREIALTVLQRNAYFAHHENIILAMLGDDDESVRRLAVNKVLSIR